MFAGVLESVKGRSEGRCVGEGYNLLVLYMKGGWSEGRRRTLRSEGVKGHCYRKGVLSGCVICGFCLFLMLCIFACLYFCAAACDFCVARVASCHISLVYVKNYYMPKKSVFS